MTGFLEDLRYGLRQWRRWPGSWLLCVLVLSLGIGANATIYTTIRGILLAPIAAITGEGSVVLWTAQPLQGRDRVPASVAEFHDWREQARSFQTLQASRRRAYTVTGGSEAERLNAAEVSCGFFEAIRGRIALGRGFESGDCAPGRGRLVVLSDALWRSRFQSDRDVAGKTLLLDGASYTIAGVADAAVWYPSTQTRLWTALADDRSQAARLRRNVNVLGTLKTGVTLAQANQEMEAIARRLGEQHPDTNAGWTAAVHSPYRGWVTNNDRLAVVLVFVVSGAVLLIACSNVASLLVTRALARRRETAVRLALGAARWRLVRQAFAESLWLALPAGIAGLLAASWTANLVIHSFNFETRLPERLVDWQVAAFTMTVALVSTVLFGMAPAIQAARPEVASVLQESGVRSSASLRKRRLATGLVVAQVALASALLAFGGVLFKSMMALHRMNPGYQTKNMVMIGTTAAAWKYTPAEVRGYFEELSRRLKDAPGVEAAGGFSAVPTVEGDGVPTAVVIDGKPESAAADRPTAFFFTVTHGALETLRIPILRGRSIAASDAVHAPRVAVVSQAMANRHWPNQDPIGQRLRADALGEGWHIVIGVAADVKPVDRSQAARAQFYVAQSQRPVSDLTFLVRTRTGAGDLLPSIRQAVRAFDPEQPAVFDTLEAEHYRDLRGGRAFLGILGVLAGVALLMSAAGLYGVLSHLAGQRIPEIGIRMALGATPAAATRLIVADGARIAAIGLAIGLACAIALGRAASSMLFDVSAWDPPAMVAAGVVLALATAAACLRPARLAASANPASILRGE